MSAARDRFAGFDDPFAARASAEDAAMHGREVAHGQEPHGAEAVLARHESRLMRIPGVNGVAVGGSPAAANIVVYVNDDAAARRLPRALEGVPVEASVTGRIDAYGAG